MKNLSLLIILGLFVSLFSCRKEQEGVNPQETDEFVAKSVITDFCGVEVKYGLFNTQNLNIGTVIIYHDENDFYVHMNLKADWRFSKTSVFVGDCATTPVDGTGYPVFANYPYQGTHGPTRLVVYKIPMANLPDCMCISVYAQVKKKDTNGKFTILEDAYNGGKRFVSNKPARYFNYCKQVCEKPCTIGHRTQTQGGWGTTANGNNPGAYRDANFASAFPSGLVIGDACGYKVTFTSASAIKTYLPDGGPASALGADATNPTSLGNVFAGQVTALSLSVGFDLYDANFGVSDTPLKDLVVASGTFAGKSVGEILDLANKALAGCGGPYTIAQLNEVVSSINENFVDGEENNGFLKCR